MAPNRPGRSRSFRGWILCVVLLWLAAESRAAPARPMAEDPVLEQRVNLLAAELRCLVCQNQSLADSHADLAIDLKNQVREQLRAGRSEQQVITYMTERYGDFVLYRPPVKATTLLLWGGPLLLLLLGAWLLWRTLGRAQQAPLASAELEPALARRLDALLAHDADGTTADRARRP
jgi:cytochrome c-type biogenesis protein CcmH/NrfF